ncbi:MAG: MFS transporter, partial [Anaerolineae bacterium]|nr:MFS transporter [Anaerolineae bacterium]
MTTLPLTKLTPSPRLVEVMVMLVSILGTGMLNIDTTAINVALPAIQLGLGADIGDIQWLIDIFILTLATLLLIGGAIGDRYGRARMAALGAFVFSLASLASGLAQSLGFLLAMRALQGVGGALLAPNGLALINATIPAARRGRMIGLWATITTVVIAVGPLLGGWLVDQVSWRAIFLINVPLGFIACGAALRYIPESRDAHQTGPLDWPGAVALIMGLGGLLFALIEGPHLGWRHPLTV